MTSRTVTVHIGGGTLGGGTGVLGLLGVAFVVLRLTGVIDWPWWVVTAPLWGSFALATLLGIALLVWVAADRVGQARRGRA